MSEPINALTTPEAVQIEAKLKRLAELKAAELEFAPIKHEIEQTRIDLQALMQRVASMRTPTVAGLMAVRSEKTSLVINDEDALAEYLAENAIDVMAYYKLDAGAVKALAEERLAEDGELLPGVDSVTTEVISIRAGK